MKECSVSIVGFFVLWLVVALCVGVLFGRRLKKMSSLWSVPVEEDDE